MRVLTKRYEKLKSSSHHESLIVVWCLVTFLEVIQKKRRENQSSHSCLWSCSRGNNKDEWRLEEGNILRLQ